MVASVIAGPLGPINKSPEVALASQGSKWEAQPGSDGSCTYFKYRPHFWNGEMLDFAFEMRGFGSREDRPGQGLLDNMRAAKNVWLNVENWKADFVSVPGPHEPCGGSYEVCANATFTIRNWPWTLNGVHGATLDASSGRADFTCTERT
ncbi:MAG: hypothetical protein M1832_002381 [Thelocarpon impressellum]|nr:MAG: hypothetical protein M1832_002381 [Thelocarpon impressellum]